MEPISNQLVPNPPKSGVIADTSKTLAFSSRQTLLAEIAEMVRKLKCLPMMERMERASTVQSWELALAEISDEDLHPSFQRAARNFTDVTKPFGVPQILAAYDLLRSDRERERRLREIETDAFRPKSRWQASTDANTVLTEACRSCATATATAVQSFANAVAAAVLCVVKMAGSRTIKGNGIAQAGNSPARNIAVIVAY
ncbi:MAG: hypothetical protein U0Y68_18350 [Blastocatellia bacterium]